jgi:hypothetical protein
MKHADASALDRVLARLRELPGLKEKKRGVFYFKSRALLHFHQDPTGLYAGLRVAGGWKRSRVTTVEEQGTFLKAVDAALRSVVS